MKLSVKFLYEQHGFSVNQSVAKPRPNSPLFYFIFSLIRKNRSRNWFWYWKSPSDGHLMHIYGNLSASSALFFTWSCLTCHWWFLFSTADLHSLLDVAKIADSLVFVLDTTEGWDSYGDYCLSCLFAQGLPSHGGCKTYLWSRLVGCF